MKRVSLKFCVTCSEKSIATKIYIRARDGVKCCLEYCINFNPSCQYRSMHEILNAPIDETPTTGS